MSSSSLLSDDPPILYELLVYEEWVQDPEPVKCRSSVTTASSPKAFSPYHLINCLRKSTWSYEEYTNALDSQLPWKIALSPSGLMVAILQDCALEVRSQQDDFTSIVGKATVPKDVFPQLRLLKWHPKNSKIAISSSSGTISIFDAYCNHLYSLPEPLDDDLCSPSRTFVAGIEFLGDDENDRKANRVIAVYCNGVFSTFALNEREPLKELYSTQLGVGKVSCAVYNSRLNLLFVSAEPQPSSAVFKDTCFSAGLSAWRLVLEEPYCVMVFPTDEEMKMYIRGGILNRPWIMGLMFNRFVPPQGVVVKLSVSQSGQYLASLHTCNTIIIWHIPSLRMYRKWSNDLVEELSADSVSGSASVSDSVSQTQLDNAPVDIAWRHDEKLIVSRKDGSISVHHIDTFETCYGSGSELLSGHPQISSTENFPGFISLECDTVLLSPSSEEPGTPEAEKSILNTSSEIFQSTIYYITDIDTFQPKKRSTKLVQKIYRMIGIKSTTPEELFCRRLEANEYSSALELAFEYNLNTDEVYKKAWRTSLVSDVTIHNYLRKVKNISWVLNECTQRVPESLCGAKHLYNFGLELTSLNSVSDGIETDELTLESLNLDELTPLQKEKLAARAVLVDYGDKLQAYSLILGGDPDLEGTFDMTQHDRFRKLSIVESAVYFARDCKVQAIEVIFKHYTSTVSPFWFNILENIPEIISPTRYKQLLPQCDEEGTFLPWKDVFIRRKDWIQNKMFENIVPSSMEDISLVELEPVFEYNNNILSQWYCRRISDLESRSGLLQHSLELVEMAIERNVKGLEDLNAHLVTLDSMVYELGFDIDLSTLLNMNDLQKCIKLMERTDPENFVDKLDRYFFPFIARHKIGNDKIYNLYVDFLTHTSTHSFESVLLFIRHIIGAKTSIGPFEMANLLIQCVYTNKALETMYETLETIDACKTWMTSLSKTRNQTDSLELLDELRNECSAASIFAKYERPPSVKAIHEVKGNETEVRKLTGTVVTSAIRLYHRKRSLSILNKCLRDILSLQELVFECITVDECYQIYASALLGSNHLPLIEFSSSVLCCKREDELKGYISFEKSRSLVVEAARKYFDFSQNVDDVTIARAKSCLFLIKDNDPEINKELNLIEGLRYLEEAGVNIVPIQLRNPEGRVKLLNLCFEKSPQLYMKSQLVYKLASKLGICGNDVSLRHNIVTMKLAYFALNDGDVALCVNFCMDMVANTYKDGWNVIYELLKTHTIQERYARKLLWCFCVAHAPSRILNTLFMLRNAWDTSPMIACDSSATASLVATPDSEMEDYHLASSDSSHKLDEPSDAELIPSYTRPCFYSDTSDLQGDQFAEYRITSDVSRRKHPFENVLSSTSDESLLPFLESRKFRVDPWIVDSRLLELSCRTLNKDTLAALGFLLNLSSPLSCEDFLDRLPQVPFTNELAVYYYSYCSLRQSVAGNLGSPNQVVQAALAFPNAEFMSSMRKYCMKLESIRQAKSLKEEDCGVDYLRFVDDESYKTDTIFGLAMSPKTLGIALDLASKNQIPLDEIIVTYLNAVFLEDKVDDFIKSHTDNSNLTSLLKSNSQSIIERFQNNYHNVDGCDYKKMSNFFRVINTINETHIIDGFVSKEHLKLLKRIESTIPGLDYKEIFHSEFNLLSLFQPFLQQSDTVANCVKLFKSLPKNLRGELSASRLYYEFCLHQFHTLCLNCQSLKQCSGNFETILPTLAKLNVNDLLELVQNTICCGEVVKGLDHIYRRQLLVLLLKWCQDPDLGVEHSALVLFTQGKLERLDSVWPDEIEEIMPGPVVTEYLCDIELCEFDQHEKLVSIVEEVLHNPNVSDKERHLIKQIAFSLIPSCDPGEPPVLLETSHETRTLPGCDSRRQSAPETELDRIKQFCDSILSRFPSDVSFEEQDGSPDNSGVSRSMLEYLFSPKTIADHPSDDTFYTRYEVAETIILADLPPPNVQDLRDRILYMLEQENCDDVFLAWLCCKYDQLNLRDRGSRIIQNLEINRIVDYLSHQTKDAKKIMWVLVNTQKYPLVASYFLSEANTAMLQICVEVLAECGMLAEAGSLEMHMKRVPECLRTFASSYR